MISTNIITVDPFAKGLIFDIDGTLADTMPAHFKAWMATAEAFGFHFDEEMFLALAGVPTPVILEMINEEQGLMIDVNNVTERKEDLFLELSEMINPIPEVMGIIEHYEGKLPMSAGTGGIRRVANHILRALSLEDVITIVVTADDVRHPKPHPETFLNCAQLMGVEPMYCQVFEDGEPGLQAGTKAGMIVTDIRVYLT